MTAPNRCLVADDVRAWRELLTVWCGERGDEVIAVSDGREAEKIALSGWPDLVVTDIDMPNLSGLELLVAIRSNATHSIRKVPVIIISSLMDDELESIVKEFGGNFVLPKPLEKAHVMDAMDQLCEFAPLVPITLATDGSQALSEPSRVVSPKLRRLAEKAFQRLLGSQRTS